MQHAVRGAWLPCFSRPDRGGAGASWAGGHGNGANRIDRPGDAVVQGLTPGDTVRYPAQGVEGKNDEDWGKRLCACAQSGSFVPKVAAKVAQFCAKVADSR